jgi:hypothetical protein
MPIHLSTCYAVTCHVFGWRRVQAALVVFNRLSVYYTFIYLVVRSIVGPISVAIWALRLVGTGGLPPGYR